MDGIRKTKSGALLIDLDTAYNRDRYYQGDRASVVLRYTGQLSPEQLTESYNDYGTTPLDLIVEQLDTRYDDDVMPDDISYHRRGYIVQ